MDELSEMSLFKGLSEASEDIYFFINNMQTNISTWSDSCVRHFNLPEEYKTNTLEVWLSRIHPNDRAVYIEEIDRVFSGEKKNHACLYRAMNADGKYEWIDCAGHIIKDDAGNPTFFVGIMTRVNNPDKYDRVTKCLSIKKYKEIGQMEQDIHSLIMTKTENIGLIVVGETMENGRYDVNEPLEKMFSVVDVTFQNREIYYVGKNTFVIIIDGLSYVDFSKKRKRLRDYILENENDALSYGYGWCRYAEEIAAKITMAEAYQKIMESRMVSAAQKRYYALDKLTKCATLEFFTEYAGKIIEENAKDNFVFVYFNIDNFKTLNNEEGYDKGDEFLREFAQLLTDTFTNYIRCRMADDHFVVLTDEENLISRIESIHDKVHKMNDKLIVEVKSGICVYEPDMSVIQACDYAKMACDTLKGDYSKFYCYYDDKLREKIIREKYIVDNLENAIKDGRIEVYYQQIVRVLSGNVCACESLARWNDAKYGFLPPAEFIPVLEKYNLIDKLDTHIVDQVCKNLSDSLNEGKTVVPISVNFSRKDFALMDVYEMVTSKVKKYNVTPGYLHVEVTESALNDDEQGLVKTMKKLREGGFEVWLDDFGSEYSTLNTLQNYTFDVLKIDMKFFSTYSTNTKAKPIITSVIDMAKQLNMRVLAEGIETEEQYKFLKQTGCDKAQGYYLCKPKPLNEIINSGKVTETSDEAKYYDQIAKVNYLNLDMSGGLEGKGSAFYYMGIPSAIVEYKNGKLKYIFANEPFEECLRSMGVPSVEASNDVINDDTYKLRTRLLGAAQKAHATGKVESVDFIFQGNHVSVSVNEIADNNRTQAFLTNMVNLSTIADNKKSEKLEMSLNFLYSIYDRVDVLDITRDTVENIYLSSNGYAEILKGATVRETLKDYEKRQIAEEDRDKFAEFYDIDTIDDRMKRIGKDYIVQVLRTIRNNRIDLMLYMVIRVDFGGNLKYMSCVRDVNIESGLYCYDTGMVTDADMMEQWYETLAKEMNITIVDWNLVTGKNYANGAFYKYALSCEKMEDLLYKHAAKKYIYSPDVPLAMKVFDGIHTDKGRVDANIRLEMIDGTYRWNHMIGLFQRDLNNKLVRVMALVVDIDEDMLAREELLKFINHLPNGIGIFEVINGVPRQVYMNDGFYNLVRDNRDDRRKRQHDNFINSVHPDDRKNVNLAIKNVIDGSDFETVVCRACTGDGGYVQIRMSSKVSSRKDNYISVLSTYVAMEDLKYF